VSGFDSTLVVAVVVSLVAAALIAWLLRPVPGTRRAEDADTVTLEAA
jgi:hypothetical protein